MRCVPFPYSTNVREHSYLLVETESIPFVYEKSLASRKTL